MSRLPPRRFRRARIPRTTGGTAFTGRRVKPGSRVSADWRRLISSNGPVADLPGHLLASRLSQQSPMPEVESRTAPIKVDERFVHTGTLGQFRISPIIATETFGS